jgi:hypothetical protein
MLVAPPSTVLTMPRLACAITVSVAVTVAVLLPTDVVNEPGGMVFVPLATLVTTVETEHDAPGGITVPRLTLRDVAPAVAVTVELTQVVAGSGAAALVILAGYRSTKVGVNVAEVNACVLVKVITKSVVPPALMVDGVNDLATAGWLGVMVSVSAAVHVPVPQPAPVLVTPDGTEIDAVLVTCVCAKLGKCNVNSKRKSHRPPQSAPVDRNPNTEDIRRLSTFFLLFFKKIRPVDSNLLT